MSYDSTIDTLKHIKKVAGYLNFAACELLRRANCHDDSKLEPPEKEGFDKFTPLLASTTYGSDEYNKYLDGLKDVLKHHYAKNSHHPEHFENGVNGMNLFDLVEMFFDWKAASERHDNGDIYKSIDYNKGRFVITEQLCEIFRNTADFFAFQILDDIEKEEC